MTSSKLVRVNGFMKPWPKYGTKLALPRNWMTNNVCYKTGKALTYNAFPSPSAIANGFKFTEMPTWVIEDPYNFIGWFLFENDIDAMSFKLKYF
jgi:hypothetical protein